jgi:hypothetical protein
MTKEQAIERLKKMIQINNGVIKEARKNGDIFAMQLTADLDTDSIAIETVLSMLEEKDKKISGKDKIIDLMAERVLLTEEEWKEIKEKNIYNVIKKDTHKLIKQYFENKAREVNSK